MRWSSFFLVSMLAATGCAHHQGNNYAYAPPYAPPVYPQPQSVTQPVAYAAAPGPAPGAVVPAPPAAAATVMPPTGVVTAAGNPCPQDCGDGSVVTSPAGGVPVVFEGSGQTPPCPPGP